MRNKQQPATVLTKLHVLRGVSSMKHCLFPWFQRSFDGCSFDVVVEVTGQKVGKHHGGKQVDCVTWLSVDLLGTARNPLGRLLLWVVLLLYDHAKPAKNREIMGWD